MAGDTVSSDTSYSNKVGLLFVFNLIVGTGALALPKSFQVAGYGASILLIHISCFTSYICATFVIESMAVANAALQRIKRRRGEDEDVDGSLDIYKIKNRTEVSEMAKLFLNRIGLIVSYLLLVFYLFGDLAIYSATVSKSIMNIVCDPVNSSVRETDRCWRNGAHVLDRRTVYRIAVFVFTVLITPMVLAGVTRTKYLQLSTTLCRWTAFILMILLASISLFRDGAEASPAFVNINNFGSLFGTTVYAFMCHHSLPGLITPIGQKHGIMASLGLVYAMILLFYIALSLTGSFAFEHVFDVYTLNFFHDEDAYFIINKILNYFLALFPVFTLSTNYPIVANTLANNLCVLFDMFSQDHESAVSEEQQTLLNSDSDTDLTSLPSRADNSRFLVKRCSLIAVIILPVVISLITNNVLLLASLTGSYPGVGVQYIIPSLLVLYARKYNKKEFGVEVPRAASSPFRSAFWPCAMLVWSTFTVVMVSFNLFNLP